MHRRTVQLLRSVFIGVVVVLGMVFQSACLTTTRWTEVRLADTRAVDVEEPAGAAVERTDTDVLVRGKSILTGGHTARAAPAVVRTVLEAPTQIETEDGRYRWRQGAMTASTPTSNLKGAELGTMWNQTLGLVPSIAAIVLGGACAIGFGIAGPSLIQEGVTEQNDDALTEGVVLSSLAVVSAGVVAYGVVTFALVRGSPFREPLPIE